MSSTDLKFLVLILMLSLPYSRLLLIHFVKLAEKKWLLRCAGAFRQNAGNLIVQFFWRIDPAFLVANSSTCCNLLSTVGCGWNLARRGGSVRGISFRFIIRIIAFLNARASFVC